MMDKDQDGLSNFAEQLHGGDPNNPDTDGDCITDDLEVAWAQSTALNSSQDDIAPLAALTQWDADLDGTNDSEVLGCDLAGVDIQPVDDTGGNDNVIVDTDMDDDGILNEADRCPDTPAGVATDAEGCSSEQRAALVSDSTENTVGDSAEYFFLTLMILALVLSAGAYVILRGMRAESEDVKDAISEAAFAEVSTGTVVNEGWQEPVLNATRTGATPEMLAKVPGWTAEMVEQYLAQGWTVDQLVMYYQEQVAQHTRTEQH
jgi:hypothetical protein